VKTYCLGGLYDPVVRTYGPPEKDHLLSFFSFFFPASENHSSGLLARMWERCVLRAAQCSCIERIVARRLLRVVAEKTVERGSSRIRKDSQGFEIRAFHANAELRGGRVVPMLSRVARIERFTSTRIRVGAVV